MVLTNVLSKSAVKFVSIIAPQCAKFQFPSLNLLLTKNC